MASSYFTINPVSGISDGILSVSASTINTGQTDLTATITISDGQTSQTVSATQLYKPYFTKSTNSVPASGGTINLVAHTEYAIAFRGIPSFATVKLNGNIIAEGQQINASTASGATFNIEVSENTGASRSVFNTFRFVHYLNGNEVISGYINFTQDAGTVPTYTVDYEFTFHDFQDTNEASLQVTVVSRITSSETVVYLSSGGGEEIEEGTISCQALSGEGIEIIIENVISTASQLDVTLSYGSTSDSLLLGPGDTISITPSFVSGTRIYINVWEA